MKIINNLPRKVPLQEQIGKLSNLITRVKTSIVNAINSLKEDVDSVAQGSYENLIPYPYYHTTVTRSGITFTDNGDGTVTANGTATTTADFYCQNYHDKTFTVSAGKYTMSGCPEGGSETTFFQILGKQKDGKVERVLTNTETQTIELTEETELYVILRVYKGTTVNNITFKPMLERGSIVHEYKSYSISNAGLQYQTDNLKYNLNDLISNLDVNLISKINIAENSNFITVGKKGARFTTINAAITEAKNYCSATNRVAIFIYPGTYNEQITLLDNPGIDFIGSGTNNTFIKYNGSYPNCTIYTTGTGLFENLTIINTNTSGAYAIHYEIGDTSVIGTTVFKNCVVNAVASAMGIGLGANCTVIIDNCLLYSSSTYALYFHNNAYSNRTDQAIHIRNCMLTSTGNYDVLVDDACNSNGNSNSYLSIMFANNISSKHKMVFRKNTNDSNTNKTYLPNGDNNISIDIHSTGNDIYGLTYGKNQVVAGSYSFKTENSTPSKSYWNYSCPFPDADRYNWIINDVTVPGIGSITSYVSIENIGSSFILLKDTSNSGAGYNVSVSMIGTAK